MCNFPMLAGSSSPSFEFTTIEELVPSRRYFYVTYQVYNRGLPVRKEQAVIPQTPMEFLVEFQKRSSYGERIARFDCIAEISEADYDLIKENEPDCLDIDPFYADTKTDV